MNDLTESLLAILLRATIVISLAAVLVPFGLKRLKCRSASVYRLAICLTLLVSWATAAVRIPVPVPAGWSWWPTQPHQLERDPGGSAPAADQSNEAVRFPEAHGDGISSDPRTAILSPGPQFPAVLPGSATRSSQHQTEAPAPGLSIWLLALWAAGLLLVGARGAFDYVRFARRLPPLKPGAATAAWSAEWEFVQRQTLGRRAIPLQAVAGAGPLLCRLPRGFRLVVPADEWGALTPPQRLAILRHEAEHVRRGDVWKSLAIRVLALPHWFNPLAWRALRLFDECAEWACDDAVRRSAPKETAAYARALLCLGAAEPQALLLTPAASGRGLALRIRRLLAPHDQEDSMMKKAIAVMLALGLGMLGLMRFQAVADERSDASQVGEPISEHPTTDAIPGGKDSADAEVGRSADAAPHAQPPLVAPPASRESPVVREPAGDESGGAVSSTFYGTGLLEETSAASATEPAANTEPRAVAERDSHPDGEAVINMKRLFKNLNAFEQGRQALREEIDREDRHAQREQKSIAELQRRLQSLEGDDPNARHLREYLTSELTERKVMFESRRADARRRFLKAESELYYSAYQQIKEETRRYAHEHGIRIVRRSDAVARDEVNRENPAEIMQLLNRDVVFIDEEPLDITDEILERLNERRQAAGDNERQ